MNTGTGLAAAVESILSLHLRRNPQLRQQCSALEGKVIAVEFLVLNRTLYFVPHDTGIAVQAYYEGDVTTRISGTLSGFARLAGENSDKALFEGAFDIQGDTEVAQQLQEILSGSDWDWEEQLSRVTGDALAHQAGKLARQAQQFARDSRESLRQDISEYLQEEVRLLPAGIEMKYFLEEVDELRAETDRLAARVQRLLSTPDTPA